MLYTGHFRNNDTSFYEEGELFKVLIITNFQKQEYKWAGELTLGDSPFTVSYEGDDENLYKPYKCSTATVNILWENYNLEFNTSSGNNVYVALLKHKHNKEIDIENESLDDDIDEYDVEWVGFATPNAYTQNYERIKDYFELECQDAISTLKYMPFKRSSNTGFRSILIMVTDGILKTMCYKSIEVTDAVKKIFEQDEAPVGDQTYLLENNWFDEEGEASSYLDIIEEFCKFYNLTLVPIGNKIYIMSYDGIYQGMGHYFLFEYSGKIGYPFLDRLYPGIYLRKYINNITEELLDERTNTKFHKQEIDIQPDDISENGTTLSVQGTYKRFSVKDDLYTFDTISPDLTDNDYLVPSEYNDEVGWYYGKSKVTEVTEDGLEVFESTRKNNQKVMMYYYKNYDSSKFTNGESAKFYVYGADYLKKTGDIGWRCNGTYDEDFNPYWRVCQDLDKSGKFAGDPIFACPIKYYTETVDDLKKEPSSINLEDAIMISQRSDYPSDLWHIWQLADKKYDKDTNWGRNFRPLNQWLIEINTGYVSVVDNEYIVLNPSIAMYINNNDALPLNDTDVEKSSTEASYIWVQLEMIKENGVPFYFDGNHWISDVTTVFKLYIEDLKSGSFCNVVNNQTWKMNLGVDGYCVPLITKENDKKTLAKFTLRIPRIPGICKGNDYYAKPYYPNLVLIKDLDIKLAVSKDYVENSDTDNNYYITTDSDTAEEFDEINCKISSWREKKLSNSSLLDYKYTISYTKDYNKLESVYNAATGEFDRPEILTLDSLYRQYGVSPTRKLKMKLKYNLGIKPWATFKYHYFPDSTFILNSWGVDYKKNQVSVDLVEKNSYIYEHEDYIWAVFQWGLYTNSEQYKGITWDDFYTQFLRNGVDYKDAKINLLRNKDINSNSKNISYKKEVQDVSIERYKNGMGESIPSDVIDLVGGRLTLDGDGFVRIDD